jgi:hypothetical protein
LRARYFKFLRRWEAAMPVELRRYQTKPKMPAPPDPPLWEDLLNGAAVSFCILVFAWGLEHLVFDYLANPNFYWSDLMR